MSPDCANEDLGHAAARVGVIGRTMEMAHQEWRDNNFAVTLALLAGTRENLRGWQWRYLDRLYHFDLLTLKGYVESIQYSMPSYARGGVVEVAFASQKRYISLYIMNQEVLNRHRDRLEGLSVGKGCIRFTRVEQIDFPLVETLLRETRTSGGSIC